MKGVSLFILIGAACLVLVGFPSHAQAQLFPQYPYQADRIYQVRTGLGITTQIELSPYEKILDYSTGFSSGWDITRRENVFYLKPKNVDVDNVSHAANTVAHTATLGITAIDQLGAAIAEPIRHAAQTAVQYAGDALHVGNIAGAPHLDPQHPVDSFAVTPHDQPNPQKLARAALYGITPTSSIDAMFDALYQASVAQDQAAMSAVSQAYLQSPHGQDFLQQSKEYNQQLEMQQAIQQQTVRREPSMGR